MEEKGKTRKIIDTIRKVFIKVEARETSQIRCRSIPQHFRSSASIYPKPSGIRTYKTACYNAIYIECSALLALSVLYALD